jgi:peroxiredoxin
MTLKVGDKLPDATFTTMTSDGPQQISTDQVFGGKTVAMFALPGAFTPTCSARHLPGYVEAVDAFRAKGVDSIVCVSVNDAFVMGAWGESQDLKDEVLLLADGNAEFTKRVGLELDGSKFGMGLRSQRYSALVENGVVKSLNVEEPGQFKVSSAEHMLEQI